MNADELDTLFKISCNLLLPYLQIEGGDKGDPGLSELSLKKGIEGLNLVLKAYPSNWNVRWMLGKAKQAQGLHEEAYSEFYIAHMDFKRSIFDGPTELPVPTIDVMRELSLECLRTNRIKEAVYYCQMAIEFDPEDNSLWSNMAIAHLLNGNLKVAETWAAKSSKASPTDVPTANIMKIIEDVKSGKREMPTNFSALEKE